MGGDSLGTSRAGPAKKMTPFGTKKKDGERDKGVLGQGEKGNNSISYKT